MIRVFIVMLFTLSSFIHVMAMDEISSFDCSKVENVGSAESLKVSCDSLSSSDINVFIDSLGWVETDDLKKAKLCIYDKQFFGILDMDEEDLEGKDKAVSVRLIGEYDNGSDSGFYEMVNILGADNDYLTTSDSSELILVGRGWQRLGTGDTVDVKLNPKEKSVSYFVGVNSYFSIRSMKKKYKAHVKLDFQNCTFPTKEAD